MGGGDAQRRPSEPGRPLSMRAIVVGGVVLGVVGAAIVAALLYFYGGGTDRDRAGLDVVRTAGTLVAGAGGLIALVLAARRQRSTELTLEHQREVAVEQRITELYTRAVDQLGNEKAPVRLGGLHALERLAQDNPVQRQTIIDVICAYLRMPYTLPDDKPPSEDASAETHTRYEQRRQELQVRLIPQRIMATHLETDSVEIFWPDIDLDLTEAHLHELNLSDCHIRNAQFGGTQFSGQTWFAGAQFAEDARFVEVQFSGSAEFAKAQFAGDARFDEAKFFGDPWFNEVKFSQAAKFNKTQFSGDTRYAWAELSQDPGFRARISHSLGFAGAQFFAGAGFIRTRARPVKGRIYSWPATWSTREAGEGEEDGWLYLVRLEE